MRVRNPKITIGILTMNGLDRLKKIIPSIVSQKYKNKEIVVVDNWSTDGSLDYLRWFKNIKIIENWRNLWYWAWKNILVKESSWEYILMLDNDIELIKKNLLEVLLNEYIRLEKCYFLSPMLVDIDNLEKTIHYWLFNTSIKKSISVKCLQKKKVLSVWWYIWWAVFFEKQKFLDLWKYDEIYPFNLDDYDMSCRAYLQWWNCYVYTKDYCIHHGIESNTNKKTISFKYKYALSGFCRIILKNYSIKNIMIWLPVSILWISIKSIKFSISNRTFWPFIENIKSFFKVLKDLADTLQKRKSIQENRIRKKDSFLKIKPPIL